MVPAALVGVDVRALLDRAERMAHACAACVPAARQPRAAARRDPRHLRDLRPRQADAGRLAGDRDLGAWLEQLIAESTGKHGKGIVPVDGEPLGAPDVYGDDRLFVYLRLATDDDAEQDAPVAALERAGQPVVRHRASTIATTSGGEFFRWEFATAVAGSIIGINPFDQPDVEDAKIAARELTDAYDASGSLPELHWFYDGEGFRLFADERNARELAEAAGHARSLERVPGGRSSAASSRATTSRCSPTCR